MIVANSERPRTFLTRYLAPMVGAAFSVEQVIRLRNWYVSYLLLVFLGGGFLYASDLRLLGIDAFIYLCAFLIGYSLWRDTAAELTPTDTRPSLRALMWVLVGIGVARLGAIAYQALFVYGPKDYLSGAALVGQIKNYGHFSIGNGWYIIADYALNFTGVASCALYVRESLIQHIRPRFGLIAAIMIGMPILELQRSYLFFGVVFIAVAYICSARVGCDELGRRLIVAMLAVILAVAAGLSLGLLRENALFHPAGGVHSAVGRVGDLVRAELSPVLVYSAIRENTGRAFDFQLGRTIVGPLAFKLVPRSWAPHKPTNSAAFYMTRFDPKDFAVGFVLSPTFWAGLYLNFGYAGSILGSFLLGLITGRADRIFTRRRVAEVGWLLILYYNYYLLLRQDIADMLAVLALTSGMYLALGYLLRAPRKSIRAERPRIA